jgi:hypothetical protein
VTAQLMNVDGRPYVSPCRVLAGVDTGIEIAVRGGKKSPGDGGRRGFNEPSAWGEAAAVREGSTGALFDDNCESVRSVPPTLVVVVDNSLPMGEPENRGDARGLGAFAATALVTSREFQHACRTVIAFRPEL